jgi:single-stranded DNA-specific DHH superfamily exonuclease
MKLALKTNRRLGVFLSLFILVFSSGVIIAHQCHTSSENPTTIVADHHGHTGDATTAAHMNTSEEKSNSWRIIGGGCVAIAFVVLLVMRKNLLAARRTKLWNFRGNLFFKVQIRDFLIDRRFALSLPQLGIIRI